MSLSFSICSAPKRAAIAAAAREGKLPELPDFSADTYKRFARYRDLFILALRGAGRVILTLRLWCS